MAEEVTGLWQKLGRKTEEAAAFQLLDDVHENIRLQTPLLCRAKIGLHCNLKRELNRLFLTKIYSWSSCSASN